MAAATVDAVRLRLAGELGKSDDVNGTADPTKLESFWTPIVARATAKAEAWLRNELTNEMGLPAEVVAVWPMFVHYHEDLALFFSGEDRNAQLSADVKSALDRLDRRAEIRALTTVGGVAVTRIGQSASGSFAHPATGSVRNPLSDVPRRYGDVPFPRW